MTKNEAYNKLKNRIIWIEIETKMHEHLCGPIINMDLNKIKRLLKKQDKSDKFDKRQQARFARSCKQWKFIKNPIGRTVTYYDCKD